MGVALVIALVASVIALVALLPGLPPGVPVRPTTLIALVAFVVKVFCYKGHPGGHNDYTVNDVLVNILFEQPIFFNDRMGVALVFALVASVVKVFCHKGHPGGHKDHTVNDVLSPILNVL